MVTNPPKVLRGSVLTPGAVAKFKEGLVPFFNTFGDCYVYGYRTGGHLTGIVRFSSTSSDEFEQVKASVNASIASFVNEKLTFKQSLERLRSISTQSVFMLRGAGSGSIPTMDNLIEEAGKFPDSVDSVKGKPQLVSALVRGYGTVENRVRPLNHVSPIGARLDGDITSRSPRSSTARSAPFP
jgi:hypothetical protein